MNALAADSISSLIAPPIRALAVAATGGGPRTRSERQRAALSPIAEDALVVALPRARERQGAARAPRPHAPARRVPRACA